MGLGVGLRSKNELLEKRRLSFLDLWKTFGEHGIFSEGDESGFDLFVGLGQFDRAFLV